MSKIQYQHIPTGRIATRIEEAVLKGLYHTKYIDKLYPNGRTIYLQPWIVEGTKDWIPYLNPKNKELAQKICKALKDNLFCPDKEIDDIIYEILESNGE